MKTKQLLFTLLPVLFFSVTFAKPIHTWEVHQLKLLAEKTYTNPYLQIPVDESENMLEVHFTGTSGDAAGHELTLVGCWNGDNEWIINFSAPIAGKWEFISKSKDKGLNNQKGEIEVMNWTDEELNANQTRRGLVQIRPEATNGSHHFQYADGTPFLWIGDTWWNWTDRRLHIETFQKLVDNRAEKGFNIGQLFVPGNGWGRTSSLLNKDYTELDLEHVKEVEDMIAYANSKGITVWIHGWWSRPEINEKIGTEKMKRWWKYLVHRFGAYNVIWTLAGEYNMHNNGGFDLSFWKELGRMVKDEDPYDRILSVHNTPPFWDGGADAPQWSTGEVLNNEPWLDYNQSQTGHGRYANEMIPYVIAENYARKPVKPIVVTEPWYEFVEGNPTGRDIRLAAWGSILSGAAGHTYGGGHVWRGRAPELGDTPAGTWPVERGFERTTYDYEGAVSMGILAKFFNQVDWWTMQPHPELVRDSPQPFCLASQGKEYVLYLRYGGYFSLRLENSSNNHYQYYFMNPSTGEKTSLREIEAQDSIKLSCPSMYPGSTEVQDWVVHIKKID